MNNTMQMALKSAAAAIAENDKLQGAITVAERDLQAAITTRLKADGTLAAAEADSALNGGMVEPARLKHTDAVAGLNTAEARLLGLQQKQRQHRPALESATEAVTSARRELAEDMVRDFSSEWERGCELMGQLLARRAALESILGPLSVSAPVASADREDIGPLGEPQRLLALLRGCANNIPTEADVAELEKRMRVRLSTNRGGTAAYDPSAIYQFRQAQSVGPRTFRQGEYVSGRLLGPATGAWMLNFNVLRPASSTTLETSD